MWTSRATSTRTCDRLEGDHPWSNQHLQIREWSQTSNPEARSHVGPPVQTVADVAQRTKRVPLYRALLPFNSNRKQKKFEPEHRNRCKNLKQRTSPLKSPKAAPTANVHTTCSNNTHRNVSQQTRSAQHHRRCHFQIPSNFFPRPSICVVLLFSSPPFEWCCFSPRSLWVVPPPSLPLLGW